MKELEKRIEKAHKNLNKKTINTLEYEVMHAFYKDDIPQGTYKYLMARIACLKELLMEGDK